MLREFGPVRKTIPRTRSNGGVVPRDEPSKPTVAHRPWGEEAAFINKGQPTRLAEGSVEYERVGNASVFVPEGQEIPLSGPVVIRPETADYKKRRVFPRTEVTNKTKGVLVTPLQPKPTRVFDLVSHGRVVGTAGGGTSREALRRARRNKRLLNRPETPSS